MELNGAQRPGMWRQEQYAVRTKFAEDAARRAASNPEPWKRSILRLKKFIAENDTIRVLFIKMFQEQPLVDTFWNDPTEGGGIRDYDELLLVLNHVVSKAPEWNTGIADKGMIGVPMFLVLNYALGTVSGRQAFKDDDLNQHLHDVLNEWGGYLKSIESTVVLGAQPNGWLCPDALTRLAQVANAPRSTALKFEELYVCDPLMPAYKFLSWDDFFVRRFRTGVRPVASPDDPNVIANACEAQTYNIACNVRLQALFFAKGQPYSVSDMLAHDPRASYFAGGTIYQGFLSALSYHRWHAPVSGIVVRAFVTPGTYFSHIPLDDAEPGIGADVAILSQRYLSAMATRAVILIRADNEHIGLVGFIAIGMDEISSCDITIKEQQRVEKGEQLGMFHYGGSSHCLLFRSGLKLHDLPAVGSPDNVAVCGKLAHVVPDRLEEVL